MSITPERKSALINEYATKPGDTGSPVSFEYVRRKKEKVRYV